MLISTRHHLRPALVALATLAGLLLAPAGASAGCEAMKSAGDCPPSMVACCCNTATAEADATGAAQANTHETTRLILRVIDSSSGRSPCAAGSSRSLLLHVPGSTAFV